MKIVGITGSSGSGKSTVCECIKKLCHAQLIDADKVAKELQDNKTEYYKKIVETFGKDILFENGLIDRKRLGKIVFSSETQKAKLDKLTARYVADEIKRQIRQFR